MEIDIEIDSPSLVTHLAVIFEREDVKKTIEKLRKTYVKDNIFKGLKEWDDFYGNRIYSPFDEDLYKSLKDLKLSANLANVFKQAIVLGKITSFTRVETLLIPNDLLIEIIIGELDTLLDGNYTYALLTPPEATEKEITDVFRSQKKWIKRSKELPQASSGATPLLQPTTDTISNISRDKKWYEKHESGKSYSKIASEEKAYSKEVVIKAIKQYERKIKSSR